MPESSSTSTQLDSRPPIPTACLLSDEELIASFTPQEQRFYQWHLETEEQRDYLLALISDPGAYDRFHEEAWPNREEYLAYMQWSRKWLGRHMERMFYRMPDEVFFEQLRSTNLTKEGDLGELCWTLNMCNVPLVVLGEATFDGIFTCYAIRPSSNFLYASPPLGELTKTRGDLMHENALAINLNVSTDTRGFPAVAVRDVEKEWVMKGGIEVPDSVDIHPDEPDGKTNFVFAQLGELCTYVGDWETERTKSLDDIVGGTWQLTGFGVVAEISSKGLPKALWAIYNTHLPTERLSDEEHRVHDLRGGLGGWIFKKHAARSERDTSNRFFAARITNNLMGFGPAKKLEFEIFSRSEVQIVPAMVYQVSAQQPVVVPLQVVDLDSEK
ncbi:Hypothetical protein NCS54_00647000 [Fusarium falciforme]|uniref:Hypothetical protein n=1 Tax=Fusarium falciforme TaxID=195108 RepID=UPI00230043B0|nr:Hypothetical protein NCS54_00647000 [Fusarium falciforme]WAO89093.1 Hypothetical protein NCS54_00647000 [Fusarium falciforme]